MAPVEAKARSWSPEPTADLHTLADLKRLVAMGMTGSDDLAAARQST
jgi:hypothetical protein